MNEQEFIARFEADHGILEAWGSYIAHAVCMRLEKFLGDEFKHFLKMEPKPRVKELNSALHKAFVVKKEKYNNPYEEMEDKVGLRFVVLLGSHVDQVGCIIEDTPQWKASRDVDFEKSRVVSPYHFDKYQSLHYVLKATTEIDYNGIKIPAGTPCEVQIRTLLQHAHSELTHDSFYKPSSNDWKREKKTVERLVARGMALIETTDALFEEVISEIMQESKDIERWIDDLDTLYRNHIGRNSHRGALSNQLIVESYIKAKPELSFEKVKNYFENESNIGHIERIRERAANTHLYRLPAILLAYFVAKHYKYLSKKYWPLTERNLEDIFTDVGYSLD